MPQMKVGLQEWISAQVVGDDMLWKGAFGHQVGFIRDVLTQIFARNLSYDEARQITTVISTHRSKSIVLPVCRLDRPDLGLSIIVRDNFHDWKLSVISEKPIEADFSGLFHTTPPLDPKYTGDYLSSCYFEGFPEDLIFGYYEGLKGGKKQWSASIGTEHQLYMTIFLILRSLGAIKPYEWDTQEAADARRAAQKAAEAKPTVLDKMDKALTA